MSRLKDVLNDFYSCVNIPIMFISKDLELVLDQGYTDDLHNIIENTNLYKDIHKDTVSNLKLVYFKSIHFVVLPLLNNRIYKGYFVIGPFKSENICNEIDIPFKPFYCIDYICLMLRNIIKEKIVPKDNYSSYVRSSIEFIHSNYYDDIKIDDVCNHLSINKSYFCSIFKKETGYTFTNFLNKFRVEKSKSLLLNKEFSILDVAMSVGYNNHNYYSTIFKKYNQSSPIEFRNVNAL